MGFKNFRLQCTLRVFILIATIFLFFYLAYRDNLLPAAVILGSIAVYEVYSLIHYVEKTNRDLSRFWEAVKHEDFSQTFTGAGLGSSFNELKTAFNDVLLKFRKTKAEKEEYYRYLHTIVQHIGIGLLSYQKNGEVDLINTAAKRLLEANRKEDA